MLTLMTRAAIAVLFDISSQGQCHRCAQYDLFPNVLSELLLKLEFSGLIILVVGRERGLLQSYELRYPLSSISLLDILEATGEHLNCNRDTDEELYMHYGVAARRLGVINHMTRLYLSEIKASEL